MKEEERMTNEIIEADNLPVLRAMPGESIDLIYIDPPFNTGKIQARKFMETIRDETGDRSGFKGNRYRTHETGRSCYPDSFDDYLGFLKPRLQEAHRLLRRGGSFFLHIDFREVHYCKVLLDEIFGRRCFQNEIIWAYDYGARAKNRWPTKHDTILWFTKSADNFTFNLEECDRIPYMAPSLVGEEKAARGKTPTDVWWHTIVSPTGREKTGYATQKPLGILERIVKVHSNIGDSVLDFFAGSGSMGEAAALHERKFLLIDQSPQAFEVMCKRLKRFSPIETPVRLGPKFGT